MTLDEAPDVLTVLEAAAIARVGRNAMYDAVNRGEIYSVRIGRSVRIPKIALRRFLGVEASGEAQQPVDRVRLALLGDAVERPPNGAQLASDVVGLDDKCVELGRELGLAGVERHGPVGRQLGSGASSHGPDGSAPDHMLARSSRTGQAASPRPITARARRRSVSSSSRSASGRSP